MKLQQTKIINLIFGVLTVCLSILSFNASASGFNASASEFIVPDQIQHSEFLYGEWKSNRPSAVLFIDPICPYCKKVIPKLDNIHDFNLYVFWSPIFGDQSEKIIEPLFGCDKPTAEHILLGLNRWCIFNKLL